MFGEFNIVEDVDNPLAHGSLTGANGVCVVVVEVLESAGSRKIVVGALKLMDAEERYKRVSKWLRKR